MRFFVNYLATLCQIQARLNVSINAILFSILYLYGWLKNLSTSSGEDRALAIFQSLFVRNKASVRVTDASRLEEIAETTGAERSVLSPVGLVKSSGYFAGTDYFKEGLLTIQDETSQLVAPNFRDSR